MPFYQPPSFSAAANVGRTLPRHRENRIRDGDGLPAILPAAYNSRFSVFAGQPT